METINKENDLITQKDVAEMLHCCVRQVSRLRLAGIIPAARYGKMWMFRRGDIEVFIQKSVGEDFNTVLKMSKTGLYKHFEDNRSNAKHG